MMHTALQWVRHLVVNNGITAPQLGVYLTLLATAEFAPGTHPFARPSVAEIARSTGLHSRTVQYATAALADKGLIRISAQRAGMSAKGKPSPNVYYLVNTPPGWTVE